LGFFKKIRRRKKQIKVMKKCIACGEEIHPKRLEILPSATRCVACSNTKQKAGITVTKGTGDHTYNETIIMEHDEYVKFQETERLKNGKRVDEITHPDDFEEEVEEVENDEVDPTELK
jgi:hypothetical protein